MIDDKFKIKIESEHGTNYLKITHNGYQWSSLAIYDVEEARAICKELIAFYGEDIIPTD